MCRAAVECLVNNTFAVSPRPNPHHHIAHHIHTHTPAHLHTYIYIYIYNIGLPAGEAAFVSAFDLQRFSGWNSTRSGSGVRSPPRSSVLGPQSAFIIPVAAGERNMEHGRGPMDAIMPIILLGGAVATLAGGETQKKERNTRREKRKPKPK